MRINSAMSALFKKMNASWPPAASSSLLTSAEPAFVQVDDSILLKNEFERSKTVTMLDFPDRTGFECFINHIHLPFDGSQTSFQSCLEYVGEIQRRLAALERRRPFLVIMSVSGDGCVVRFHECRPHENWAADDLEAYTGEAVLILPAGDKAD